jgi:hypothetical protein
MKSVCVYLVLEVAAMILISSLGSIPIRKLLLPFFLYLIPAVLALPLILNARRISEKPGTCAIVFASAVTLFCLLITIATVYSAIALGFYSSDAAKDIPVITVFSCTIVAVVAYRQSLSRLNAERLSNRQRRQPSDE